MSWAKRDFQVRPEIKIAGRFKPEATFRSLSERGCDFQVLFHVNLKAKLRDVLTKTNFQVGGPRLDSIILQGIRR